MVHREQVQTQKVWEEHEENRVSSSLLTAGFSHAFTPGPAASFMVGRTQSVKATQPGVRVGSALKDGVKTSGVSVQGSGVKARMVGVGGVSVM